MRVRSNAESKKLANAGRGSLVPTFKWEVGRLYNLVFLTDSNGDQIMYQENIHKLNFSRNGKTSFDTVRCVKGYVDETPDPLNPNRAKNTGVCPYCEVARTSSKLAKAEKEAWEKENPGADKETKETAMRKINSKKLVNPYDTERYYLCAEVLTTDKAGAAFEMDEDGVPKFKLVLLKVSSSQYDKKLSARIADVAGETGSETLDYVTLRFKYADSDAADDKARKMASAKDLDISFALGGVKGVLAKYPTLEEKIRAEVAKLETAPENPDGTPGDPDEAPINKLDEKLYSFIPESETTIENTLSAKCPNLVDNMTDEEKEQFAKDVEASQMTAEPVSAEDITSKFQASTPEAPAEATVTPEADSEPAGFDPEA